MNKIHILNIKYGDVLISYLKMEKITIFKKKTQIFQIAWLKNCRLKVFYFDFSKAYLKFHHQTKRLQTPVRLLEKENLIYFSKMQKPLLFQPLLF